MRNQVVTYAPMISLEEIKESFNKFEYRKDRPLRWLQRICIGIMRGLGCYANEHIRTWSRHEKENNDLLLLMLEQYHVSALEFGDVAYCFVGPEQEYELMKAVQTVGNCPVKLNTELLCSQGRHLGTFAKHVPIIVIPWMKGVLFVPKSAFR